MTAALEREAVGQLMDGWTTTPVVWPNRDYTAIKGTPFVRVAIRSGEAFQVEIGSPLVVQRHPGLVIVSVFGDANNKGDKATLDIADAIATRFRRQLVSFTDGSVRFRTPTIRAIGQDGAFYQVNVICPFVRDYLF